MIGYGCVFYFRHHSRPVEWMQDNIALFTGAALMIAIALAQIWITRARFRCPRCRENLWYVHEDVLRKGHESAFGVAWESSPANCPHCGLNLDDRYA
jgi:hypothetical protein